MSEASDGISRQSIDLNYVLTWGVGSEGQGTASKRTLRIKGNRLDDEDFDKEDLVVVLDIVKVRKNARDEQEEKEIK